MSVTSTARARLCVIFNPTARGERAARALRQLRGVGESCALKPTQAAGAARLLAAEAVREGYETVVAMGGDGTVHEVVNGLADAPEGLERTRLAVLPVGTVNVFARELGIPFHFQRAWEIAARGREQQVDLPTMEFQTRAGREQRWFVQMAGCGLDARAVELMSFPLKKRIGQFAYVVSGLRALCETPPRIRVSDGTREHEGQLVLLGNGRLYGGPIPVFERADLRDGLLDVVVFPKVNWFVILRYACAYVSERLLRRGAEHCFQARQVTIESVPSAPVELDGEHVGGAPATCTVRPQALRVVVP